MRRIRNIGIVLLAGASFIFAQTAADNGGWKRVGDSNPNAQPGSAQPAGQPAPPPPNELAPPANVPPQLTLRQGTFLTVRINQALSSDRNQQGDAFTATLVQPLVVDGFVVAQPGQTLAGRVDEAKKAGRVSGTSHLAIQLTDLTLIDGQQVPLQTQLITRNGSTSTGQDAAAIGTTTGIGAAVGAISAGGEGAAIGAGAGAVASTIGVLLTRGHPTIVTPESVLTFRIESPVTFSTERAPQAFRVVQPRDYNQPAAQPTLQRRPPRYAVAPPPPYYYGGVYPYYDPWFYGSGFYPGFYGPSVFIGVGGRFGGRRR